jgi:hypothetical protein
MSRHSPRLLYSSRRRSECAGIPLHGKSFCRAAISSAINPRRKVTEMTIHKSSRRARMMRVVAVTSLALSAAAGASVAVAGPASAAQPSSYTVSTDWKSDWNGGCSAKATVTYYPGSDTAVMNTTVRSPYWFAACRVRTHLQVKTASGIFEGVDQYVTACAVLDPSCASTQSTGDQTFNSASPAFTGFVNSLNAQLEELGLPPTTRQAVARGISISFSKA